MERIRLTRDEKIVLRCFAQHDSKVPEGMTRARHTLAAKSLQRKGLADIDTNLYGIRAGSLNIEGRAYLEENPKLRNPFSIGHFMNIVAIIAASAAVFAVVVGCCRLIIAL